MFKQSETCTSLHRKIHSDLCGQEIFKEASAINQSFNQIVQSINQQSILIVHRPYANYLVISTQLKLPLHFSPATLSK